VLGPMADSLEPHLVSPVVAYLVHQDCPVTGEIYSVGGGRVSRVFVAATPGWVNKELTAEDVRDHFDEIRAEDGYIVPANSTEEVMEIAKALSA
jgi:hypothetical protein